MGNACGGGRQQLKENVEEPTTILPILTRCQVAKHNKPDDCWMIIDNVVYNVSEYWKVHPGGGNYIKRWAGKDATLPFREFNHTAFASAQLASLGIEVGTIDEDHEKWDPSYFQEGEIKQDMNDIEYFEENNDMFCFQCQQTAKGIGCTDVGVCGKSPEIAALQDLIIHQTKGLCQFLVRIDSKFWDEELFDIFLIAYFMTLTNVNFNMDQHLDIVKKLGGLKDKYQQIYEKETPEDQRDGFLYTPQSPSIFKYEDSKSYLYEQARQVGIIARKGQLNPDIFGLLEMTIYGLKGACAYMYHSEQIRKNITQQIQTPEERIQTFRELFEIANVSTEPNPTMEQFLEMVLNVGKVNYKIMEYLDRGHNLAFGTPSPSNVNRQPVQGKCILVSGHDLMSLKKLLDQTQGQGVNVFTHGEMLPAFGYPELKKYSHLVGNFGTNWYNQNREFHDFPGSILVNSNCLIQPQNSYAKRIFTTETVGWDDIKHIKDDNFSELIACAKKQPGFKQNSRVFRKYSEYSNETTGYAYKSLSELLIPEVKKGNITSIYLVGGCDNLDPMRLKYSQQILELPKTSIVLTLGCGKFRLLGLKDEMGVLPGNSNIPRLLDVGQCNDTFSVVKIALALKDILGVGINELPLHLILAWVEQKSVVILLTLLHLGIQNINLGPNLPGFLTPNVNKYLSKNYKFQGMKVPKQINKLFPYAEKPKKDLGPERMFEAVVPFQTCKLLEKREIAENTWRYKFAFQNPKSSFHLTPGKHIIFRAKNQDGKYVSRAYTPITDIDHIGDFDMISKVYDQGLFSSFLKSLEVGDSIECQGPCGNTVFLNINDQIVIKQENRVKENVKNVNLIAGGTSVVSMFQIIQDIIKNDYKINFTLLVAKSKKNLKILEEEIQEMVSRKGDREDRIIRIKYITSDVEGRISKEIFKSHLFSQEDDKDVINLLTGPLYFRQSADYLLKDMGYNPDNLIQFY